MISATFVDHQFYTLLIMFKAGSLLSHSVFLVKLPVCKGGDNKVQKLDSDNKVSIFVMYSTSMLHSCKYHI